MEEQTDAEPTVEEFLAELTRLYLERRNQDAFDYMKRHGADMRDRLTPEQSSNVFDGIGEYLAMCYYAGLLHD